jgi:DNA-binding response OmpR family regulator
MDPQRQILVVEDEPGIAVAVNDAFEHAGYLVVVHETTGGADRYLQRGDPALVILDRMLPDGDGLAWLAQRRAAGWTVPCLVLSARGSEEERCQGLEAGADDYLPKPFGPRELLARAEAVLRRAGPPTSHRFRLGKCLIDLNARTADGKDLTEKEHLLLNYLHAHRGRIVSREELLRAVWNFNEGAAGPTRAIDMCLVGLRRKLGDGGGQLKTIRGGGYRLDPG